MGIHHRPLLGKGHCLGARWRWGILPGIAVVRRCCFLDSLDNPAGKWVDSPDQGVRLVLAGSWVDSSGPAPSLEKQLYYQTKWRYVALICRLGNSVSGQVYCNIYIWHSDQLMP